MTIINKFGGDKKIEVARGRQSEGVLVLSSHLSPKAIDLSTNSTEQISKLKRSTKKPRTKDSKAS